MATINTQQSRYRMISIMTFVLLLLSFAYYYFIYVKSNEDAFNNKAFRIIERTGKNVEQKFENFSKVSKNTVTKFDTGHQNASKFKEQEELINIVNNYPVPEGVFVISGKADSLREQSKIILDKAMLPDGSGKVILYTEMGSLVQNALRKGFFQKYIVFSDNHVFWADFATPENLTISLDTLFKQEQGESNNLFHSTDRLEVKFNNQTQLLYFTPLNLSGNTMYIGGIVEKSFFREQAFELGTNTLIVVLMLLALLILSLPFLKFLLLSENERLGTWDAVFSFVVMALGSGFVMLSLLIFFAQSGPSAAHKKELLKTYAQKIETQFFNELKDVLQQIQTNDSLVSKIKSENNKNKYPYDSQSVNNSIYKYARGTFWMNAKGKQLVKWQRNNITKRVDVSFRKYFSVPNRSKSVLWSDPALLKGDGFYIEAIRAVTTGRSFAMISKKSQAGTFPLLDFGKKKATVVSMGSKLESLTNLSLPSNISYLVIDAKGLVMFHKDSTRIMQENLFEETNNNQELSAAVYGRSDTVFRCNYNEVHSRFYITPLGNLPLFLLVVLDEDREKMTDAHTLSLTVLFYLLLLILLGVQLGLFVATDYRRKKKVRGYSLFFQWVWPVPAKKKVFQLLSIYLLLAILLFIVGRFYENVLLSYSFFSLLLTVNLFVLRGFHKPFIFVFSSVQIKYSLYFAGMLVVAVLLFPFHDELSNRQLGFSFIFIVFSLIFALLPSQMKNENAGLSLQSSYNNWVFLFVISLGILPVLGFYTRAYNFEKSVYLQHVQFSLAKNIVQHGELDEPNAYRDYKSLNAMFYQKKIESGSNESTGQEFRFIRDIRIQLGKKEEQTAILQYPSPGSEHLARWEETKSNMQLTYSPGRIDTTTAKVVLSTQKIKISPVDYLLFRKSGFDGFRLEMLVSFLLLMVVLYLVVNYWSTKLFLLDIIPGLKTNITSFLKKSSFVYIVSPPHAGVRPFVENQLQGKVYFEDLRYSDVSLGNPPQPKNEDEAALIFDSGSLDNTSLKHSIKRIDALKQLVLSSNSKLKKLVVISQFTPKKVANTVKEWEQMYSGGDREDVLQELKKLSAQYLDILGGFDLSYFKIGENKQLCTIQGDCLVHQQIIGIQKLDTLLTNTIPETSGCDSEDQVLNTQNSEQLYYHAIWNSLEKREHLLIYDLAQDGLVNYRNMYVVYNLMSRGILIYRNGRLRLFNKSFANFVLTIIDKEQALEFERDAKRTGSWANLKLPLMIVIAAVLMFMFLSQQEVFNQLIGWFTAAIALLPVLTRLMVTFTGFSKK